MEPINQINSGSSSLKNEKLSALIVDDNTVLRMQHKFNMVKRGFFTTAVENGKEAVDLYAGGNCFDIIIMDMEMPVMDGIEATKKLREMGVQSVIIGASAATEEAKIEAFVKAGLDKYYAKPLTGAMFRDMIQSLKKN